MKIRNLLVLVMTMALTTLCVSAQENAGNVTVSDRLSQSLTISPYGTVLEFKDKNGKSTKRDHTFKICTCGKEARCFESNAPAEATKTSLAVGVIKPGSTKVKPLANGQILKSGQTLAIVATIWFKDVTVTRRLAWLAGSSLLNVVETISADKASVCDIQEMGITTPSDSCGMPPPRDESALKCPPPPNFWSAWLLKYVCEWRAHLVAYTMDLSIPPKVAL